MSKCKPKKKANRNRTFGASTASGLTMAWYAALIRAKSSLACRLSDSVEFLVVTASGWYSLVMRRKARFTSFSSKAAVPDAPLPSRDPSWVDRPRRTYGSLVEGRGEVAYPRAVVLVAVHVLHGAVVLAVDAAGRDGYMLTMCCRWGLRPVEPDDGANARTVGTTARRHSSAPVEAEVVGLVVVMFSLLIRQASSSCGRKKEMRSRATTVFCSFVRTVLRTPACNRGNGFLPREREQRAAIRVGLKKKNIEQRNIKLVQRLGFNFSPVTTIVELE